MAVVNKVRPGDGDPRHGADSTYQNHGCRCNQCLAAHRDCMARMRLKLQARDDPPDHGDNRYVNYGCRCEECKAAHSAARRRWAASASVGGME